MRTLEFAFSGSVWVQLEGTSCLIDGNGNSVDPNSMTDREIVEKLENGEIYVSFSQSWKNANADELETYDYHVDTCDFDLSAN